MNPEEVIVFDLCFSGGTFSFLFLTFLLRTCFISFLFSFKSFSTLTLINIKGEWCIIRVIMIKIPAYLTSFSSRQDGSMRLSISTQELIDEDKLNIMRHQNAFGWLVFKENDVQEKDIPKIEAEKKGKTPSQRLRNTLFVLWKQRGEQGDFETFYKERMEKFIKHTKALLDD